MPLSDRPEARARQLANLRTGPPAAKGNRLAVKHGGYAAIAADRLDAKACEVFDALAADAPLREAGELPAADSALVRLAADCLCRLEDVAANVRDFGVFDQRTGDVRPAVELEGRLRREAADYLDALGMTPRSRAKLGLDVQRGFDLAKHWAEADDVG